VRGGSKVKTREPKQLKRKVCKLCVEKVDRIDYKDDRRIGRFVTDRGKIVPRRISGTCARHQKQITLAVKRARILALLPFTSDQLR
jgi:small subunit ribosomal protein S18